MSTPEERKNPIRAIIVGESGRHQRPLLMLDHWVEDGHEGLLVTALFAGSFDAIETEVSLGNFYEYLAITITFEVLDEKTITYTLSEYGRETPSEQGVIVFGGESLIDAINGRFFRSIVGD